MMTHHLYPRALYRRFIAYILISVPLLISGVYFSILPLPFAIIIFVVVILVVGTKIPVYFIAERELNRKFGYECNPIISYSEFRRWVKKSESSKDIEMLGIVNRKNLVNHQELRQVADQYNQYESLRHIFTSWLFNLGAFTAVATPTFDVPMKDSLLTPELILFAKFKDGTYKYVRIIRGINGSIKTLMKSSEAYGISVKNYIDSDFEAKGGFWGSAYRIILGIITVPFILLVLTLFYLSLSDYLSG